MTKEADQLAAAVRNADEAAMTIGGRGKKARFAARDAAIAAFRPYAGLVDEANDVDVLDVALGRRTAAQVNERYERYPAEDAEGEAR